MLTSLALPTSLFQHLLERYFRPGRQLDRFLRQQPTGTSLLPSTLRRCFGFPRALDDLPDPRLTICAPPCSPALQIDAACSNLYTGEVVCVSSDVYSYPSTVVVASDTEPSYIAVEVCPSVLLRTWTCSSTKAKLTS